MAQVTQTAILEGGDTVLKLLRYELKVRDPQGQVTSHAFDRREVVIGSNPDVDLSLDDESVSRQHCLIEVGELGYRLRDLNSKNGTYVGGMRVNDLYLEPGATFAVGRHLLQFEVGEQEVEIRLSGRKEFGELIGGSVCMREVFGVLGRVAPTDTTVLIEGESGTGKELAARALHDHSGRGRGPFVVFDCSAVPAELMESELFGHLKGAFTGAVSSRKGAFERAQGGTLLLDEVGELSLELQPKLLRVLESRQVTPVGGGEPVTCDVRIVAATNRDLKREVSEGHFREDLYYRLAVIQVVLPPLRRRPEDIPLLVERFLGEVSRSTGKGPLAVSFSTMEKLKKHRWPGNVRELRNFVERAAVLAEGDRVETRFLKLGQSQQTEGEGGLPEGIGGDIQIDEDLPFKDAKNRLVEVFEKAYWTRLLERTGGNISKAARIAGVHRKSAEYILRKLELGRGDLE
ncbi:MAG: sigma 54-interacting transcriptional regulator [Bradymonadales bacterium]|nr:sigma 54-interacting transcriptional regulator [Bradymonadales bacterium]